MSQVIYKEKLRAVLSVPYGFKNGSGEKIKGTNHFMQTENVMPNGMVAMRKIKIKDEMLNVCHKLKDQFIDVVVNSFAKGSGQNAYVEFSALQPPVVSRS